jgi:hypothetical protein
MSRILPVPGAMRQVFRVTGPFTAFGAALENAPIGIHDS